MTSMFGVSLAAVVCPSASAISPCKCVASSIDLKGLLINCAKLGLSDSKMSTILNVLINSKGISPVVALDASSNSLTKVPKQLSKFNSTYSISLNSNQINSIPSGVFSSTSATSISVYFFSNKITSISSGAFNYPNATYIYIGLPNNKLTSISSGVFISPSATSVTIALNQNQITGMLSGVFNYPKATYVNIVLDSNKITSIPSGVFILPNATQVAINLSKNQIKSIASGAFSFPSAYTVYIILSSNKITTIPTGAFNLLNSATSVNINLNYNLISSIASATFYNGNRSFADSFSNENHFLFLFILLFYVLKGIFQRFSSTITN